MERFGRYKLLRRLGQGGMAEVFLAQLASGDAAKHLAIKRLLPTFSQKPRVVRRLANEARLTVWLTHPNIVQVFDFGRIDGLYFIAMEFVDGCDLRSVIRPAGRSEPGTQLPLEVALDVGLQLCDALRYAHRCTDGEGQPLGIIHRDISPHNVLISRDGHPKLADFGVARAAISDDLSRPGAVLGKLSYMPPEQAKGLPYDARVDIYACGAVLYEMLTGVRPFAESNRLTATTERRPDPPSRLRPSIPRGLDELVLRAMSPRPEERFPDAESLSDAVIDQLGELGGRPKPHQLAGLVREALGVAQPAQERPAFVGVATRVGRHPSAEVAVEESVSPVSVDRHDYDPGEDSLIEPEVTAVRSFLGGKPAAARGEEAEWFQPRGRQWGDTRPSPMPPPSPPMPPPSPPMAPPSLMSPSPPSASDVVVPRELAATETLEMAPPTETREHETPKSTPAHSSRRQAQPSNEPGSAAQHLARPPLGRAALTSDENDTPLVVLVKGIAEFAWPRRRWLLFAGGGLLLFWLGVSVGRFTASPTVSVRRRGVLTSLSLIQPPAGQPRSQEHVARSAALPRDGGTSPDAVQTQDRRPPGEPLSPISRHAEARPVNERGLTKMSTQRERWRAAALASFLKHDYKRAFRLGSRYLRKEPTDQRVLAIVGAAACKLWRMRAARRIYLRLDPARQQMLRRVCLTTGLRL